MTLKFQNVSNRTSALVDTTRLNVSGANTVRITGTNYFILGNTHPLLTNSRTMTGFTNLALQMPLDYGGTLVSNENQILLTATLPPAPGILLNLIAVPGNATVNLSWNSATNATGYNSECGRHVEALRIAAGGNRVVGLGGSPKCDLERNDGKE